MLTTVYGLLFLLPYYTCSHSFGLGWTFIYIVKHYEVSRVESSESNPLLVFPVQLHNLDASLIDI